MSNGPMMSDEFESETFRSAEDTSNRSESMLTQSEEADGSIDDEEAAMLCIFIDDEEKSEADTSPDSAMLSLNNDKQKESVEQVTECSVENEQQHEISSYAPIVANRVDHRILLMQQEQVRWKMYPLPLRDKLQTTAVNEIQDTVSVKMDERSEAARSSSQ